MSGETEARTTARRHFKAIGMLITKQTEDDRCWQEPAVGTGSGAVAVEDAAVSPQKLNTVNEDPATPLLSIFPKEVRADRRGFSAR